MLITIKVWVRVYVIHTTKGNCTLSMARAGAKGLGAHAVEESFTERVAVPTVFLLPCVLEEC